MSIPLSPETIQDSVVSPDHCYHAFDTLYCALTKAKPIPPKFSQGKYPLFVTWNTRSSRPGRAPRLRGCIGNFDALELDEGIAEYALIAAFEDSRFNPIARSELESLECGISLLTDFEDASSYMDWIVGIHGIYITFPNPHFVTSSSGAPSPLSSQPNLLTTRASTRRTLTATYLPEVMPAQGWDKIDAIDSAIEKAGWRGPITEDLRRSIKLRRYQSRKCVVSWDEYINWRENTAPAPTS